MAQKTLNTRLKLKYDTLENWNKIGDTFIPLKGEVCFVEVADDADPIHNAPSILFKVGDGASAFSALKWGSGLAADVYSWAKAASKPGYGANEISVSSAAIAAKNVQDALSEAKKAGTDAQTTANAKYSKPSAGIPKSDLASAVQTSLGKADTALQDHQTIATGSANGTIAVAGKDVAVKGLGSAAYTESSAYATKAQGANADSALSKANANATEISSLKEKVTGGMHYKGKFDALPATTAYEAGDFIIVGTKEYILYVDGSTKKWDELGDEGSHLTKNQADGYYVPLGRTIAEVDLKDNVTKAELLTALNVADGATKVLESTVSGWGFTKNAGTLTGIKMNGKAQTVSAGVVDLGTVLTEHQDVSGKQDKLTAGSHITISGTTINATWPTASDSGYAGIGKTGTVTSVAAKGDSFISVSGSPITTSGTISIGLTTTKLVTTDDTIILDCGSSTVNI